MFINIFSGFLFILNGITLLAFYEATRPDFNQTTTSEAAMLFLFERNHNFAVGVMNKLVNAVDKYSWINNDVHTRKTP